MKKKLTIWQNRSRAHFLVEFRDLVIKHFTEEKTQPETRSEINIRTELAHKYVCDAGVPFIMKHYPAPLVGGFVKNIDLVQNIFQLRSHSISPQAVIDVVEKAVGVYEADRIPSLIRTFNPFFWIGKGLAVVSGIPFAILEHAGLHGKKLEDSLVGKVVKLLTEIVAFLTALYAFLKLIGTDLLTLWEKIRP